MQRELHQAGLGTLLQRVDLASSWSLEDHALLAFGLYLPGSRQRACIGSIRIPAAILPLYRWCAFWSRRIGIGVLPRVSLRFVLRHEYAHALAHHLGYLGNPGAPWGTGSTFTEYATTDPDEDLAETVALFLTRRGRPPRNGLDQHLTAKWRAAGQLLREGQRRRP